jgi:hypothetical protein
VVVFLGYNNSENLKLRLLHLLLQFPSGTACKEHIVRGGGGVASLSICCQSVRFRWILMLFVCTKICRVNFSFLNKSFSKPCLRSHDSSVGIATR